MANTLYINYTKTGRAIPDHMVETEIMDVADICNHGNDAQFNISTENVIHAAIALRLTNKLPCMLVIMFNGFELKMNEYGVIVDGYPKGFCDYESDWCLQILKAQVEKRKRNSKF
jgi:hypothetical protein